MCAYTYRYIPVDEYMSLRDQQHMILSHVHYLYRYKLDENGDIVYSSIGSPIIESIRDTGHIVLPSTHYTHEYINAMALPNTMVNDVLDGYYDVMSVDNGMISLPDRYLAYPLGMYLDGVYQGSVWVVTSTIYPSHICIYGIRSSIICNLQGKRGIARRLIEYIMSVYSGYTIVVPSPLPPMAHILASYGFNRHVRDDTVEYLFMSPICSLREYYTLS